ncbi:MAG: HepT-like ribonuclease domain-containing protein [Promethearchaeota archaeon]
MSRRGDREILKDILEAINRIETYTKNMNYEKFLGDIKPQDAVARNIEIIGEAVKNISSDFKRKHNNINWRSIAGTRDKIIHFYFGIKWDVIWDVVKNELLDLKEEIKLSCK